MSNENWFSLNRYVFNDNSGLFQVKTLAALLRNLNLDIINSLKGYYGDYIKNNCSFNKQIEIHVGVFQSLCVTSTPRSVNLICFSFRRGQCSCEQFFRI